MSEIEQLPLLESQPRTRYTQLAEGSESQNLNNSTNLQQNLQFMDPKDIKFRYKILMFILGVWKLLDTPAVEGKCKRCKQFIKNLPLLFVPGIFLLASVFTLLVYLFCYYGKLNHQLIFLSFVTYWLSLISPLIICIVAFIWNLCVDVFSMDIKKEDVHRGHTFHSKKISTKFQGKWKTCLILSVFALCPFAARLIFSSVLHREDCGGWYDWFWTFNDMFNIIFYTLFCYFLYLQRVALEEEGYACFKDVKTFIRKECSNCKCSICNPEQCSIRSLEQCKKEVVTFFQNYKRLRNLLLPWIWIILFCSSCGITAVFTWNYNSLRSFNVSTPEPFPVKTSICSITCDKTSFLIAKEEDRILLNLTILLRNIITAGFALSVLNGIDLKHVWDTFRERFFAIYSATNKAELGELIQFMDCMHTESTVDSFGIMFSIAGLLIGILGSDNLK